MNLSRSKTLIGLLYAVILSLPLLNIAGRVLYTQWNKNAKDSYSDHYITTELLVTTDTYLSENTYYTIDNIKVNNTNSNIYFYSSISNDNKWWYQNPPYDFVAFSFSKGGTNYGIRLYYYDANQTLQSIENHGNGVTFVNNQLPLTFKLTSYTAVSSNTYSYYSMYKFIMMEDSLDNAFEYSINKITDNNLGEVQFFTWFADLFLDLDNATNMLYVGFVNWYFNYALLVSLGYLMFMVLMWFIGLARKILEKGQNFGEGGY